MSGTPIEQALSLSPQDCADKLLQLPEDQWFDRKSGRVHPRDLAIALVAFANAEGGTIVIGLHDGAIDGVSTQRENDLRQAAADYTQPMVRARFQRIELTTDGTEDRRVLLACRVEPGDVAHHHVNGNSYLRLGDESRKLTFHQRQELVFRVTSSLLVSVFPVRVLARRRFALLPGVTGQVCNVARCVLGSR